MKISFIQTELQWENKESNLEIFENHFQEIPEDSKLIVLPEMFSTGFSMEPEKLAEDMNGWTVTWMKEKAWRLGKAIVGSIIIKENDQFFNRLIWANPDKSIKYYDKKHLFTFAGEDKQYSPGSNKLIVDLFGFKIACFICYDLRFPVWTRNTNNEYDAAIFIANWPEVRSSHWNSLLPARAIENQAYVIGVNRVGLDGTGKEHSGDSVVIDPLGNTIAEAVPFQTDVVSVELDRELLENYRSKFPVGNDADEFEFK